MGGSPLLRVPQFKTLTPRIFIVVILLLPLIPSRPEAIANGIWLDVPFVKQEKNLCGAACIFMVMQYWSSVQRDKPSAELPSVTEIGRTLYSKEVAGISGKAMEHYFTAQGFQTFSFKGEWADLQHHLSRGRPLIACLEPNGNGSRFHYVVIAGWDPQQTLVLVNDPSERKLLKVSQKSFERAWEKANCWVLLALPSPTPSSELNPSDAP
jgi:ABC-type bacteriocin/lantibiotic exporter with double-glycine peptidase domain